MHVYICKLSGETGGNMIEVSLIMFKTLSAKKKLFDNSMVPTTICFQSQQLPLTHLGGLLLQDPLNKQVL